MSASAAAAVPAMTSDTRTGVTITEASVASLSIRMAAIHQVVLTPGRRLPDEVRQRRATTLRSGSPAAYARN